METARTTTGQSGQVCSACSVRIDDNSGLARRRKFGKPEWATGGGDDRNAHGSGSVPGADSLRAVAKFRILCFERDTPAGQSDLRTVDDAGLSTWKFGQFRKARQR